MSDQEQTPAPTSTIGSINGPADVGTPTTYQEPEDVCLPVGQREWSLAPCEYTTTVAVGEPPVPPTTYAAAGARPLPATGSSNLLIPAAGSLIVLGIACCIARRSRR